VGQRLITAAVGAVVLAASCSGCSPQDNKATQKTAHITVDNNTRTSHAVICNQVNWLLTANITAAAANVRVLLRLDADKPTVESVHFDNFAGFSGVSNSGAGESKIHVANSTYTITGTAIGTQVGDPRVSVTTPFRVELGC
jgi:lipoprotein LpqH